MTSPLVLERSRTYPVSVEHAYAVVLPTPLATIFTRRYGPLPPIKGVRDQDGVWGTVGQTRTIELADGGTMRETLTSVVDGVSFGYRIADVTGPMKALVSHLEGSWAFAPVGTGTRVTWAWTVHPLGRAAGLAMPVFGRLWQGYARQALEEIEGLLVRD
ncbi:SRPBCC family protein [soil metagenome]